MQNKHEVIETLIKQHKNLVKDLEDLEIVDVDIVPFNIDRVMTLLRKFEIDLYEHMALENNIFYKNLVLELKQSTKDTQGLQEFVDQMDTIGKETVSFLERYSTSDLILADVDVFKTELRNIRVAFLMRVETEEAGVYVYWK